MTDAQQDTDKLDLPICPLSDLPRVLCACPRHYGRTLALTVAEDVYLAGVAEAAQPTTPRHHVINVVPLPEYGRARPWSTAVNVTLAKGGHTYDAADPKHPAFGDPSAYYRAWATDTQPLKTLHTIESKALAVPVEGYGDGKIRTMGQPFRTQTTRLETALAVPAGANRASGIPLLSDLREAGDIEQDSDVVVFLHEEEVEDSGRLLKTSELDLIVAKQRSGPTGTRRVRKAGHYARLYEG